MTNLEAIVFTIKVVAICSLLVGVCVFALCLKYEVQDRLRKRRRRGTVTLRPTATLHRTRRGF